MEIETPEPVEQVNEVVETTEAEPAKVETLRETLEKANTEVKSRDRDEKGKFKEKLKLPENDKITVAPVEVKATKTPESWMHGERAKHWETLTPAAKEELAKREAEVHQGITKMDEERQLGKQIRDVVTPYLATIQAEGGTPVTAVQSLLNTAHVLRTADPYTKAAHVAQVIKQFDVDLSLLGTAVQGQPRQADPMLMTMQQKLDAVENQLREQTNLQKANEDAKVQSEIAKFQSDPANKYFEQVKPEMVKLLSAGVAQTLPEAYQIATMANPTVRPLVLAEQAEAGKRSNEVAAKKKAAVSVVGSSSTIPANTSAPAKSLRAELEAQFAKSSSV